MTNRAVWCIMEENFLEVLMKKIFSIILCAAVVLISGCSGVSQEEYNSLVEENSNLTSENDQLKEELEKIKTDKANVDSCFEI